jgi:hypothetical protein
MRWFQKFAKFCFGTKVFLFPSVQTFCPRYYFMHETYLNHLALCRKGKRFRIQHLLIFNPWTQIFGQYEKRDERQQTRADDGKPERVWKALGEDSPKLLNVAAWQLLNQLGSKILLRFPFVMSRRKAGFDCPDICNSAILVWQLPKSLLAENLLHKQLV